MPPVSHFRSRGTFLRSVRVWVWARIRSSRGERHTGPDLPQGSQRVTGTFPGELTLSLPTLGTDFESGPPPTREPLPRTFLSVLRSRPGSTLGPLGGAETSGGKPLFTVGWFPTCHNPWDRGPEGTGYSFTSGFRGCKVLRPEEPGTQSDHPLPTSNLRRRVQRRGGLGTDPGTVLERWQVTKQSRNRPGSLGHLFS